MKRGVGIVAIAAICLAAAAAQSKTRLEKHRAPPAEIEDASYDGSWVFEVKTTVGPCPEIVSNQVDIRDNRVAAVDQQGVAPWGYVDSDGTFVARLTRQDGRVARIHGQLRGSAGSGAWSSSSDMCGGTWRATRSEAEHAGR